MADDAQTKSPSPDDLKREAIERVERNAAEDYKTEAHRRVLEVAKSRDTFTSHDVARLIESTTHESRALGAVMQKARKAGWIERAGYVKHPSPSRHSGTATLWRSLVR